MQRVKILRIPVYDLAVQIGRSIKSAGLLKRNGRLKLLAILGNRHAGLSGDSMPLAQVPCFAVRSRYREKPNILSRSHASSPKQPMPTFKSNGIRLDYSSHWNYAKFGFDRILVPPLFDTVATSLCTRLQFAASCARYRTGGRCFGCALACP